MKKFIQFTIILMVLGIGPDSYAQLQQFTYAKRHALVIGNSDYTIGVLTNPVNDAYAISVALEKLGFDVSLRLEVKTKDEMKRAIREFGEKLKEGGVGLFYFAGHGVQVDGFNYLIPINAQINSQEEVEYEAVEVGFVLAQMEAAQNQMNIVILDACRNNPFARSFRSVTRGLASINAPTGTLVAYSTAPGSTASDGIGKNGLYTGELLKQMQRENVKIEEVFKNVRAQVLTKSGGKQVPWESSSLIGDFYFKVDDNSTADLTSSVESSDHNIIVENKTNRSDPEVTQQKQKNTLWDDMFGDTDGFIFPTKKDTEIKPEAKWKSNGSEYWLYVNGKDISKQTTNRWSDDGKNLEVYHPESNSTFILKNFANCSDDKIRDAEVKLNSGFKKTPPLWKATADDGYWLFVNGIDISKETTYTWSDNDLKVYHTDTKTTYLLKDYSKNLDNTLRPAEVVK